MADQLGLKFGHGTEGSVAITQVGVEDAHAGAQIGLLAGREIVEHRHLEAGVERDADDVTADETGATGDQNAHRTVYIAEATSPSAGLFRGVLALGLEQLGAGSQKVRSRLF